MPAPATDRVSPSVRSTVRAVATAVRGDPWTMLAALLSFLGGTLVTWYVVRTLVWDAVIHDLDATRHVEIIAVAPYDVIFLQVQVALFVGFLAAIETVLYRARGALPLGRWRLAIPRWARLSLLLAGIALFPVGAVLGYERVVPVVLEWVAGGSPTWSVVRWARVVFGVSIAAGLVAQCSLVASVLALGRSTADD